MALIESDHLILICSFVKERQNICRPKFVVLWSTISNRIFGALVASSMKCALYIRHFRLATGQRWWWIFWGKNSYSKFPSMAGIERLFLLSYRATYKPIPDHFSSDLSELIKVMLRYVSKFNHGISFEKHSMVHNYSK